MNYSEFFLSMYTRLYGQQGYENESGQMFSMRIIFIWEFTRGSSEKFPEEFSLVTKPQYVAYHTAKYPIIRP